jgi:hypothetical protein
VLQLLGEEEDSLLDRTHAQEEPPAQPFLYKSSESVPVLYEPDTTAIKKEGEIIQPQANESRSTSVPTSSIYV